MDLKWVEDFLSLSRTGNFRESASERCVSQPAFSRRIQSLENWVGAELFDRSETPVKLTTAGVAFRPTAEELLALARQGRSDVQPASIDAHETLTINTLHTLALSFVPEWLHSVELAFGPLNGKIKVGQSGLRSFWKLLEDGASDFAISYDDGGDAASLDCRRFRSLVLAIERIVPVVAAGAEFQRWTTFLEGTDQPIPYLSYPAVSRLGRIVENWLGQRGFEPNFKIVYEAAMPEALKGMALDGRGLAWLPESCIRDELDDGRLVTSSDTRHFITAEIRIFRSARTLDPHIERMWGYLTQLYDASTVNGDAETGPLLRVSANAGINRREPRLPPGRPDAPDDVSETERARQLRQRVQRR
jgi:DNA-binding transcriptional LysR family regulator